MGSVAPISLQLKYFGADFMHLRFLQISTTLAVRSLENTVATRVRAGFYMATCVK